MSSLFNKHFLLSLLSSSPNLNYKKNMISSLNFVNILFITFLTLVICYNWRRRKVYYLSMKLPGPSAIPIFGSMYTVLHLLFTNKNQLVHKKLQEQYSAHRDDSKIIRFWFGTRIELIPTAPSAVTFFLKTFLSKSYHYNVVFNIFKNGILGTQTVDSWVPTRKSFQIGFHFNVLKKYINVFHEETEILVKKLEKFAQNNESFHPEPVLMLATFDMILRSTLGKNPRAQEYPEHPILNSIKALTELTQNKLFNPVLHNATVNTVIGTEEEELKHRAIIHNYSKHIVEELKANQEQNENQDSELGVSFAELLLKSFSEEDLTTQIVNIIFAGTDTTKLANAAVILMLALHPDVQNKAYEEIISIMGTDKTTCPTYEDLQNMRYLEMVIKESLRLFPPVPIVSREVKEDCSFEGIPIPKGTSTTVNIYGLHHDPTYYEDPEMFNPERFSLENMRNRPLGTYVPFLNGPRDCIGKKYAILQMKTIISTILRHYEIKNTPSCETMEQIHLNMNITSTFDDNCTVCVTPRLEL